jgi:hypothetical protein
MKALRAFAFLAVLSSFAFAGWERAYGDGLVNIGLDVATMPDGGFAVVGQINSFFSLDTDIYLVRTDSAGNLLWSNTYGGPEEDIAYSLSPADDGTIVILGTSNSFGVGDYDMYLFSVDSTGEVLWTKTYGQGNTDDAGLDLARTPDGGYIITGFETSIDGNRNVYVVKTDSVGDTVFTRVYGGANHDFGTGVSIVSDGGYIICGLSYSLADTTFPDIWILRLDESGDTIWTTTTGGASWDEAFAIAEIPEGFIVTGSTSSFGAGGFDIFYFHINHDGEIIWTKTLGGTRDEWSSDIMPLEDGNHAISSWTNSFGYSGSDAMLIKINPDGDTLWTRLYGGSGNDNANGFDITPDGGFIITGSTASFGSGREYVYLVRTDSEGLTETGAVTYCSYYINYGWNLISNPFANPFLISEDMDWLTTGAYLYKPAERLYELTDTLRYSDGYWVLAAYDTVKNQDGVLARFPATKTLLPGWNLIGSCSYPVHVSVLDDTEGIIPPIFGYNGRRREYFEADSLLPGHGYWILSSDTVEISIP